MRVISIDPGYERIGIAVLEKKESQPSVLFSECFITSTEHSFPERLGSLGKRIRDIITEYNIDFLAIESLFFSKNTKTALKVSEAKGVIIFQAVDKNIPVYEYTPNQIKVAVTGYGRATKKDISIMVPKIINLEERKRIDDEIDAIAVGITFFAIYRENKR